MRRLALGLIVGLCLQAAVASAQSAFGHVDTPQPGDTIYGVVPISGWVLDINQVSSVDLYVDNIKVASADLSLPRPDVLNAFPTYANSPNAQPGFLTSFFTKSQAESASCHVYSNGAHTISVKVVESTNPNVSIDIADIPVTVDNTLNQAPFGFIDIPDPNPANTEGFDSAHPVLGWAIDDSSIDHIDILVDGQVVAGAVCCNVPGDSGSGSTAGTARYGGARPDVQAAFPSTPLNARSGWGYLLLSNVLPNLTSQTPSSGNGTFTLRAYAYDADAHVTALGAKVIAVDNSDSVVPFGAIDTPLQGATVSGLVANFGWVLSPGARRSDPPGGGTVQVLVDGVAVGSPAGWAARSDLTALFPVSQYSGVGTALGVFGLDTTKLANGLHTIAWIAADNLGAQQGIGSRFFTVSNGAVGNNLTAVSANNKNQESPAAPSGRAIYGRLGYDVDTAKRVFAPDASGRIVVTIQELGRVELDVTAATGYLQTPAGRAALPAGSRIDPTTGTFTGQPGAGFLGVFDFVFDDLRVRIVITPRH